MAVITRSEAEALYTAAEGYKVAMGTDTANDNTSFGGGVDNLQEGDILDLPTSLEELVSVSQVEINGRRLQRPACAVVLKTSTGENRRVYCSAFNRAVRAYSEPLSVTDKPVFKERVQAVGSAHNEFRGINKFGPFKAKMVELGAQGKKIKVVKRHECFVQDRDTNGRPTNEVRTQAYFDMDLVQSHDQTSYHDS